MRSIGQSGKVTLWQRRALAVPNTHYLRLCSIAVIAMLLLAMPQLKLAAMRTSFFDLGQYVTVIYAAAFCTEITQLVRGHVHLLALPYVWLYRLVPEPAALLALQSVIILTSAYMAGRLWSILAKRPMLEGALVYLLSISVWFNTLFDFHFEHQIFPLFFGSLLVAELNRRGARALSVALGLSLCLVKEIYALMAVGLGLYYALGKGWRLAGSIMVAVGALYFYAAAAIVIPYYSDGQTTGILWRKAFGHLGDDLDAIARTVLTHPWRLLVEPLLDARKLMYMLVLAGSFAFIGLKVPLALLPAAPVLAVSMLSNNPSHVYLGNQYTAGVFAPLFAATAIALGRHDAKLRSRLSATVIGTSALALIAFGPSPISRLFLINANWNYGASAYLPTERDRWVAQAIKSRIPADPHVIVSVQNAVNTKELAGRQLLFAFPDGVFEPRPALAEQGGSLLLAVLRPLLARSGHAAVRSAEAEWVVIDRQRPWYVLDQGCDWRGAQCADASAAAQFLWLLERLPERFDLIFNEAGLMIFRRRHGT
jgi:uncharacterized membrane protein